MNEPPPPSLKDGGLLIDSCHPAYSVIVLESSFSVRGPKSVRASRYSTARWALRR